MACIDGAGEDIGMSEEIEGVGVGVIEPESELDEEEAEETEMMVDDFRWRKDGAAG